MSQYVDIKKPLIPNFPPVISSLPPVILSLSKDLNTDNKGSTGSPRKVKISRRRITIIVFALLAVWNLGQGGYILAKAELAQWLIASAWQQSTTQRTAIKPWPWADTWPVARLQMPAHNIDQYVLAGSSGASLAFGPGHIFASAAPTKQGNTVIAAHRDTHFSFLEQVKIGEKITVTNTEGAKREYTIQDMHIVDKNDVAWINVDTNPYQLTLVTCYPFNTLTTGGRLRYVVRAVMQPEYI
ncbi:MAG: class GN sortase [Methylophaga sp.]|nr:MAG: class GN sortase [Methylophaga sp.]